MSLLDKASLIVTPNAYKESKLYSVVPSSGAGDMDVVRATTATRVNSAGLIEVVPRNLVQYSEQFDNAYWERATSGSATITVTANSTTAPNGTTTADLIRLTRSATTEIAAFYKGTSSPIGTYKNSIWLKAKDASSVGKTIDLWSWEGNTRGYTMVTLTADWVRYEQNTTIFTGTGQELFDFGLLPNAFSTSTTTLVEFYAWGAQAEIGSTATEYFPTTTRLNIPRIDYTNGSCPSLLVEPQRTNLLTYSNNFTNASWTKLGASITANNIISPDGTLNASKLVENNLTSEHQIIKDNGYLIGSQSFSFYAKAGERNQISLATEGFSGTSWILTGNGSTIKGGATSVSIKLLTNGWYLCNCTFTSAAIFQFYIKLNNGSGTNYLGDGTSGLYIYGFQSEAGSYPTSYIPTVASTVTRNADVISKTGISSLIGQTEGTIFCDVTLNSRVSFTYFAIANNLASTENYLGIAFLNNAIAFESVVATVLQANISHSNTSTGRFKIAAAYKANDFILYINGTQIGTDTSGTIPTCSQLGLNAYNQAQALNYNSVQLYKTKLTNTELAQLTTL
jgi:hypothetical protein